MLLRSSTCAVAVALSMLMSGAVLAADVVKYPSWKGAWARWVPRNAGRDPGNGGTGFTAGGQPSFDQTKPWGRGQQAPLTPEYQKVLEESLADQANGGEGNFFDHARCLPGGMPLMTIAFTPLEFVVTPKTTHPGKPRHRGIGGGGSGTRRRRSPAPRRRHRARARGARPTGRRSGGTGSARRSGGRTGARGCHRRRGCTRRGGAGTPGRRPPLGLVVLRGAEPLGFEAQEYQQHEEAGGD